MRLIKVFILLFLISFSSCNNTAEVILPFEKFKEIPNIHVLKSNLVLIPKNGQWFYKNKPFNGFGIIKGAKNTILEKTGYYNGKREGKYQRWFKNGSLQKEAYYKDNKLTKTTKVWWKNNQLASEFNYRDGQKHGIQKQWFKNGQLSKVRNLQFGKEEGLQKAWLKNGKLYVNYEARNGRIFGMRRANLCYQLKNEKVQFNKKE